jgi:hypothetical protein
LLLFNFGCPHYKLSAQQCHRDCRLKCILKVIARIDQL